MGPDPVRRPDPSSGFSDESGTAPSGPTSSACAHAGCRTSGLFNPFSCTTSQSLATFETSTSNALGADVRPATVLLYRLNGSGGSSPSIRRAPRESRWVKISPLTSSSA